MEKTATVEMVVSPKAETFRQWPVHPVHNNFLAYRGSVKTGAGDIAADIQAARDERAEPGVTMTTR